MTDESLKVLGKKIKLIICDMDGTLLNSNREISAKTREAIRHAKSRGIAFSLSTGRIQIMTELYCRELEQDFPIIAANGAVVWDPIKRKPIWEITMDKSEALTTINYGEEHDLDYIAITMTGCYYSKNSVRKQRFLQYNEIARKMNYEEMTVLPIDGNWDVFKEQGVCKILIFEPNERKLQAAAEFLQTLPKTGYTSSEPKLLDVSSKGVSKGIGLEKLAEHMNIPREAICAMGDYENDISMIEYAGLGVAMGNANDTVKMCADYITETNDEDGVAKLIERLLGETKHEKS